jgi:hypothetical protein
MKPANFQNLSDQERGWLDGYLDGTIEPEAFEALQTRLAESAELREVMRRYLSVDDFLRNDSGSVGSESGPDAATTPWLNVDGGDDAEPSAKISRFPISMATVLPIAAVIVLAFVLGSAFMRWTSSPDRDWNEAGLAISDEEPSANGFAVVSGLFDAAWPEGEVARREGDTLGAEIFRLASGTAEIQFFSGAHMTAEGPAEISLTSAWEADCREGAVRMQVPPAARGFKLHAPSTEIIDLGTEFGLVVRGGKGEVEVFDGEIALHQDGKDERLVTKGIALTLAADGSVTAGQSGAMAFPSAKRFGSEAVEQRRKDFARWQSHRDQLAGDERLIAYYDFARKDANTLIPNLALPRNSEFDGAVILAEPVDGRWPELKSAVEFRRPGSRVRVNITGEFPAFTFMAWVRIDSLDRKYNALFMGDGYENGEPHWQIRDDGALMLSVMVDDTKPNPGAPNDAGLHRVYYSPSIWDMSMSGEWMHIASVFDPADRTVSHYANGRKISDQEIIAKFFVDTLRIGNAEIGNWGQPFREDPWFAIRNLNGRMDEFAIFREALDEAEIAKLYERSRVGGQ